MNKAARLSPLVLALLALACSEDPAPALGDSGLPGDAGVVDTGTVAVDAGRDAGAPGDARPDTGVVDMCHPLNQDCPANQKCVVENGALGAACVPTSPNDKMRGESCTGQDCVAGLACVRTSTPTCVQLCDRTSGAGCAALGADYECRINVVGTNWGACSQLPPACDPYTQAPCPADRACGPFQRLDRTWELRCRAPGPQQEGMPCGSSANGAGCVRGLACVSAPNGGAACRKFCQTNADCTQPATCSGSVSNPPFMFCAQ